MKIKHRYNYTDLAIDWIKKRLKNQLLIMTLSCDAIKAVYLSSAEPFWLLIGKHFRERILLDASLKRLFVRL